MIWIQSKFTWNKILRFKEDSIRGESVVHQHWSLWGEGSAASVGLRRCSEPCITGAAALTQRPSLAGWWPGITAPSIKGFLGAVFTECDVNSFCDARGLWNRPVASLFLSPPNMCVCDGVSFVLTWPSSCRVTVGKWGLTCNAAHITLFVPVVLSLKFPVWWILSKSGLKVWSGGPSTYMLLVFP